jgi:hypothetical protein
MFRDSSGSRNRCEVMCRPAAGAGANHAQVSLRSPIFVKYDAPLSSLRPQELK